MKRVCIIFAVVMVMCVFIVYICKLLDWLKLVHALQSFEFLFSLSCVSVLPNLWMLHVSSRFGALARGSCVYVFWGVFCLYVYISQTLLEASILGSGQSRQADCPHPFFPTLDYCDDFISCLLHSGQNKLSSLKSGL